MNCRSSRNLPDILLLTCHDLGRHLACYGVATVRSPHLDRLAAEGLRFARAFTTSPGCSPARAALATGRYPHSNGVMGLTHPPFNWDLAPGERHIAQILAGAGYQTHLFGFQHVSHRPERLGFAHLHGFDRLTGCHEHPAWGSNVAGHVAGFLRSAHVEAPLYIEVNLEEPHRPYDQGGAVPDDSLGVDVPGYLPDGPAARSEMAALQGAIRQADAGIGAIMAALEASGRADNTLVIFVADHGLAMPRAKCTLYDPGLEIAFLLRWRAGGFIGGRVVDEMVSNVDILPTVLDVIGIAAPGNLQGRSFGAILRAEPYVGRTEIHAEKTYHMYRDPMRAVRTERFKYIRNFETTFRVEVPSDVQVGAIYRQHAELFCLGEHPPVELYDLVTDPLEQRNLAGDASFVDVEGWLDSRLAAWMERTSDPLLVDPIVSPSYERVLRGAGGHGSADGARRSQLHVHEGD